MRPSNAVRTVWDAEAIDTSHLGFRPSRKLLPSTPVWGSFGESRVKAGAVPLGVQVEVVNVRTEIDIYASSNVIRGIPVIVTPLGLSVNPAFDIIHVALLGFGRNARR